MNALLGRLAQTGPNFLMVLFTYRIVMEYPPNMTKLSNRDLDFAGFPPE